MENNREQTHGLPPICVAFHIFSFQLFAYSCSGVMSL